jgi:hypothetical protein
MSGKYGDDSRGSTLVPFPATSAKALVGALDGAPVEVAVVVLVVVVVEVLKVLLKKRHHNYISHILFNRHKKGSNSFELGVFFGKIINLILFPIFSIKSPRVQLSCA